MVCLPGIDGLRHRGLASGLSCEPRARVDGLALDPPFEVKMRACRKGSGVPNQRHSLSSNDQIALLFEQGGTVFVD